MYLTQIEVLLIVNFDLEETRAYQKTRVHLTFHQYWRTLLNAVVYSKPGLKKTKTTQMSTDLSDTAFVMKILLITHLYFHGMHS